MSDKAPRRYVLRGRFRAPNHAELVVVWDRRAERHTVAVQTADGETHLIAEHLTAEQATEYAESAETAAGYTNGLTACLARCRGTPEPEPTISAAAWSLIQSMYGVGTWEWVQALRRYRRN